eukprot:CAMPEP_0172030328 /NCGR_PEP_ID=MMETSP1041-20130122/18652_1 /TAXON_ID=464988 /ORGANISM="Hemiselmis andersenii, Strain CCMP439" /LENGTH=65 /DNA_ID=CAMNT_0012686643 /DNA_START=17 /DNA_END=211 /DNA_ORIENTATION=-
MKENIEAYRRMHPNSTFQEWLGQLPSEDIARAILSSSKGTGVWRQLWDECPSGGARPGAGAPPPP